MVHPTSDSRSDRGRAGVDACAAAVQMYVNLVENCAQSATILEDFAGVVKAPAAHIQPACLNQQAEARIHVLTSTIVPRWEELQSFRTQGHPRNLP